MERNDIKTIVLTGGACSGKTTFLDMLKSQEGGSICGYRLLFVPEAATLLATHGLRFDDGEKIYQRAILSLQMAMEDTYKRYARDIGGKVCIICDRGTLDGAAYCGDVAFDELCREAKTSKRELAERYDHVLYLVSAACGAEDHYGTDNNEARRENLEEAKELEEATMACWVAHPSISVIDNAEGKTFGDKMEEAQGALEEALSSNAAL